MMPVHCDTSPNAALTVPPRVIVADDEAVVCSIVARVIARNYPGAVIITASNGQAALDEYEQHGADLIVTDLNMPQMDGLILTRCIRAQDAAIPIMLVSGNGGSRREAKAVGVTQVLEKPFGLSQLATMLTALLPLFAAQLN